MLFESVPQVLSELIRTAFIPKQGYNFKVADFSAIEAQVLVYLAGETWRLKVFETHGKIYEASAGRMFKVPMEEITKASPLGQKGKIAELVLGYGGSVEAVKSKHYQILVGNRQGAKKGCKRRPCLLCGENRSLL